MLHNYHLMFDHLLKKLEEQELSGELKNLNNLMLTASMQQYDSLKGSSWDNAAKRNVGFFAVASKLMEPSTNIPEFINQEVEQELAKAKKEILEITRAILVRMEKGKNFSIEQLKVKGAEADKDPDAFIIKYGDDVQMDGMVGGALFAEFFRLAADRIPELASMKTPPEKIEALEFEVMRLSPLAILKSAKSLRTFPFFDRLIQEACDRHGVDHQQFIKDLNDGKLFDEKVHQGR